MSVSARTSNDAIPNSAVHGSTAAEVSAVGSRSFDEEPLIRNQKLSQLLDAWLSWQCQMIAGVEEAAIFEVKDEHISSLRARWPSTISDIKHLKKIAYDTYASGTVYKATQQQQSNAKSASVDFLGLPVQTESAQFSVVLALATRDQSQQQSVMQILQWGAMWLTSLVDLGINQSSDNSAASYCLLAKLQAATDTQTASVELVNFLAAEFDCQRVSVGFLRGRDVRLQAISQLTEFDRKRSLVRSLQNAMRETLDQGEPITFPQSKQSQLQLSIAHADLYKHNGELSLLTVPIVTAGNSIGAVTFEKEGTEPFSPAMVRKCTELLSETAPLFALQLKANQTFIARVMSKDSISARVLKSDGSRWRLRSLLGVIVALLILCALPVQHKVVATASVQGADRQVLAAPQAGYIKSAHSRAGDVVKTGQILAALDDQDLHIEKSKWSSELAKIETSVADALGSRNRTEVGLLHARKQQVLAEIALLDQKLDRSVLRAPFDGVLLSGNLNQSLGSLVEAGEVLFEIASMEDYRLLLEIDEFDVAAVNAGQSGYLRISALPGDTYKATLKSTLPVAISRHQETVFQLEARLDETSSVLRPGMRGIAKIHTGREPLIWVLTHRWLERIRLGLWSMGL